MTVYLLSKCANRSATAQQVGHKVACSWALLPVCDAFGSSPGLANLALLSAAAPLLVQLYEAALAHPILSKLLEDG